MCNKAANTYPPTIPFVPEYYKTQEICGKAVNRWVFFVFDSVHDPYKTAKMCDWVIYEDPFMLTYCHSTYETQKNVWWSCSSFPGSSKIYSWLDCTSKMLEKFHDALLTNDDTLF